MFRLVEAVQSNIEKKSATCFTLNKQTKHFQKKEVFFTRQKSKQKNKEISRRFSQTIKKKEENFKFFFSFVRTPHQYCIFESILKVAIFGEFFERWPRYNQQKIGKGVGELLLFWYWFTFDESITSLYSNLYLFVNKILPWKYLFACACSPQKRWTHLSYDPEKRNQK